MKYIICLDGIKKDNAFTIEELFDKTITENAELTYHEPLVASPEYKPLPNVFKSYEKWPKYTNLKCWHCEFTFNTVPCFIPKYMSKTSIGVYGNFCSFNCAVAHIKLHKIFNETDIENIIKLYYIFTNSTIDNIIESPCKTVMKKYGGYMTDSEYLEKIDTLKRKNISSSNDLVKMYNCQYIDDSIDDNMVIGWDLY